MESIHTMAHERSNLLDKHQSITEDSVSNFGGVLMGIFSQVSLNLVNIYKTARSPVDNNKNDIKTITKNGIWDKKQKRAYNTVLTGLKMAKRLKKTVRFLTLSTSDTQNQNISYDEYKLNDSFRKLKQRIKRITVAKLIQQGYIKPSQACLLYTSPSPRDRS